jgi:hypothetical protein
MHDSSCLSDAPNSMPGATLGQKIVDQEWLIGFWLSTTLKPTLVHGEIGEATAEG